MLLPCKRVPMSMMLRPTWAAAMETVIDRGVLEYALRAARARSRGSRLLTDSFLENVMIQKLDHR